ncbi:zinc transporter ZIP6 isoform X1 [Nerophis ophidion]|uniref:zinc transporter ZIP6 isoform X1 n=2 Tax=Nerophis ophidion TaxID=159077 RepID=UPI002AE00930|nr:zinc transporter ZIP6 isoform X1 [Nerophis ophidion]
MCQTPRRKCQFFLSELYFEMIFEEWRGAVALLMFLLTVSLVAGDDSGISDCGTSTAHVLSAVVDLQRAEQNQKRQLEALFNRYGQNGTISLAGLKRLLHSVGLERVRSVTVQHHHHHHQHDDGTSHEPSDRPREHQKRSMDAGSQLFSNGSEVRLLAGGPMHAVGNGSDDHHEHRILDDHAHDHHDHDDHAHDHNDHAHEHHNHDDHAHEHHDHDDHAHEHHDHDDHAHDHRDITREQVDRDVECLNASSILSLHGMTKEGGVTLADFRYLCPTLLYQIDTGACLLHEGKGEFKHVHGEVSTTISSDPTHHGQDQSIKDITTAWLGGFVSITIISLLSLLGVVLIPLMGRVFFKFLLSFLVALAVGTLSGDAFLHLIPHSQGGHHHQHSGLEHAHGEHEENLDAVWKGLTALSGVYFMFLIEHFLTLGKMYKDKKQKKKQNHKSDPEKRLALEDDDVKTSQDPETNGGGVFADHPNAEEDGVAEEEQVMLQTSAAAAAAQGYTDEDCENKCHSHFHDTVGQADSLHHHHHDYHHILHHHHSQNHHPHSHAHSYPEHHFQQAGVAALAWMVIMGDGLHNFSDGLAIGAAFSEGLSSGLSTSVAVFCHELPHELGDFAVLLKAGMTVRQAILYNVLSAMMAYFGMVVGILIGHYAENISMWIFALTAGLFMYVALVDMVPEMLHNDAGDHGFSHCGFFLLQNAGILLGFGIMLLIAVFEHKIRLELQI